MYTDPDKILLSFKLIGGGKIEFGYAKYTGGMTVGTAPLMARITVAEGWGDVPNIWFKIGKEYSLLKIKNFFKEDMGNFIPDWLRADCYEGAYYRLLMERENDQNGKSSST